MSSRFFQPNRPYFGMDQGTELCVSLYVVHLPNFLFLCSIHYLGMDKVWSFFILFLDVFSPFLVFLLAAILI